MAPKNSADPRVVLLHGDEAFLVEEEARAITERWKRDLVSDFGFEALDPAALNAVKLRDALIQSPFLDPFRVISVRGLAARRAEGLSKAVTDIPDTTRLLITVSGRLGQGNSLTKAVAALPAALVREFQRLKNRALSDWVSNRARELGLSPSLAPQVLRSSPADLGVLDQELKKLLAYRDAGYALDREAIIGLLAGGHEEEVFRLTDHLLPRPDGEAFRVARSLVNSGQSPTALAYRLSRQIALVLEARARRDRGESLAQAQSEMSEHPFVVQKAFETAGGADVERLEEGLRVLLDYEWEVKSGQIDADLGLQGVLARL